jgi:hypothetical protein
MDPIDRKVGGYYIGPNATNGKVHQAYEYDTIRQILKHGGGTRGVSPITRRKFTSEQVFRIRDYALRLAAQRRR